jgi:hypothetical protein
VLKQGVGYKFNFMALSGRTEKSAALSFNALKRCGNIRSVAQRLSRAMLMARALGVGEAALMIGLASSANQNVASAVESRVIFQHVATAPSK